MAVQERPRSGLFATKPVDQLVKDTEGGLKRAVGLLDLTALGIGAIIGTGIFVILGEAIGDSGPAIILNFLLAGAPGPRSCPASCSRASRARSPPSPTRSWPRPSRSPAAPTRTGTRRWAS